VSARGALPGVLLALACAAGPREARAPAGDYLRYVGVPVLDGAVLLRWPDAKMPLRVHLPAPDASLASDPEAVLDAVRDGVTDWTDVARPGIPSFVFVDAPGDADIPIVWEAEASGDWYIAHCVYEPTTTRRLDVARILVTTRYQGEEVALDQLYRTVLHEMGHALGLAGHSPSPADLMYFRGTRASQAPGLSAADRATLRALYAKPNGAPVAGPRRTE
jgi:predicted Zn-dependent protease